MTRGALVGDQARCAPAARPRTKQERGVGVVLARRTAPGSTSGPGRRRKSGQQHRSGVPGAGAGGAGAGGDRNRGAGFRGYGVSDAGGWWLQGGRRNRCHRSLRGGRGGRWATVGEGMGTQTPGSWRTDAATPSPGSRPRRRGRHRTGGTRRLPAHCSPGRGQVVARRRHCDGHEQRTAEEAARTDRPLSHGHAAGRSRPNTVERRNRCDWWGGRCGGVPRCRSGRAAVPVALPPHQLARCRADVVRSRRRRHQVARCRVDVLSGREARGQPVPQ